MNMSLRQRVRVEDARQHRGSRGSAGCTMWTGLRDRMHAREHALNGESARAEYLAAAGLFAHAQPGAGTGRSRGCGARQCLCCRSSWAPTRSCARPSLRHAPHAARNKHIFTECTRCFARGRPIRTHACTRAHTQIRPLDTKIPVPPVPHPCAAMKRSASVSAWPCRCLSVSTASLPSPYRPHVS